MSVNVLLAELEKLSGAGMTVMTVCIALVLALCAFCFWRVWRERQPSEHHHVPLDIDTRDSEP